MRDGALHPHYKVILFGLYEAWIECEHGRTPKLSDRWHARNDAVMCQEILDRGDGCSIQDWVVQQKAKGEASH